MSSFFNWWSARYTTEVRYPKESALVATKEQHSNTTSVFLRDFVERRCPSLYSEFRPAWWLPKYAKILLLLSLQVAHAKPAAIRRLSIVSSEIFQLEIRWCINGDDIHMKI